MFARPVEGTTVRVIEGPHKGKVGTVQTANVQVGMVRVLTSDREELHLPTEYVKIEMTKLQ